MDGAKTRKADDPLDLLAEQPGENEAVVHRGESLTFDRLRGEAAQLARWLRTRSIGPGSVVALRLPRGTALVVSILGTLTAGAAYLPINPDAPAERMARMLDGSKADLVLVACEDEGRNHAQAPCEAQSEGGRILYPTCAVLRNGAEREPFRRVAVRSDDPAYVIHTSGTTGQPKGVEVGRGALAELLAALESSGVADTRQGRVGWNASASFDASVQQWLRVCRGDTLYLFEEEVRLDPEAMARAVAEHELTDLDLTPSHADVLLEHLARYLTPERATGPLKLLVGGEPVSPALWKRISALAERGLVRAVNLYGPTECTVDATLAWITAESPVPHIGTVLPGLGLRFLDERLRVVEPGRVGEIYLSGSRLARGYRGDAARTAERFVPDPCGGPGERMYRTGDLGRLLENGSLEYLGRSDSQIKLRGHRIEPGEIESVLAAHPDVVEAVVDLQGEAPEGVLVAYCRVRTEHEDLAARIEEFVRDRLPSVMVPSVFMTLAEFPRTGSGKLDRSALPACEVQPPAVPDDGFTPVEKMVADVWSTILGTECLDRDTDFFRLGGHSLLAIKLVAQVKSVLGVSVPLKDVYENPRLLDLASVIDERLARSRAD